MSKQRVLLQPAYVLHQRAYRDTSAILEIFTPEQGRVGLVAKGVRGKKPRWPALLQTFQPLLVSWLQGGELGLLTGAEAQGTALTISPGFIASGFYLNEMLLRLLQRHDAQLELFGWYDTALRELSALGKCEVGVVESRVDVSDNDNRASNVQPALEAILRRFEMRLLTSQGYGLVLNHEANSPAPVQVDRQYIYHFEQGPVLFDAQFDAQDDDPHQESFGIPISGQTLLALHADDLSAAQTRQEAKRLLRVVLGHYLGSKPLASRQLMLQSAQLAQRQAQ
jgi:DNA repair protein RecO (recombination protein O)